MRERLLGLVVLPALLFAACGGGDSAPSDAGPGHPSDASAPDATFVELPEAPPTAPPVGVTPTVKLYTYNTALIDANLVKAPDARRPLIVAAIKASDADVICVQELYESYGGPQAMAADLKDTFPYATWRWRNGNEDTTLGFGVLIASKHPLYRARTLKYVAQSSGTVVDRGLVAADVLTDTSYFTVLCTHLAAGLGAADITVKGQQIHEVVDFAQAQGYLAADHMTFWLGDFNAGPDPTDPSTCPANPDCCVAPACTKSPDVTSYELVKSLGFTDPNTDALGATSARTVFMPLDVLHLFDKEPSQRIDHCFYRGVPAADFGGGSIVFDGDPELAYDGPGAPQGGETLHTLSDHLGVRCAFRPE